MIPQDILDLAQSVIERSASSGIQIASAESCTGGLIGAALTAISGSSAVFNRGYITYANAAKVDLLDVPQSDIDRYGAVSAVVAEAMASHALMKSGCDMAIAVTGIAGPSGGSIEKPVGLVWFGLARKAAKPLVFERRFGALSRDLIRLHTVRTALEAISEAL